VRLFLALALPDDLRGEVARSLSALRESLPGWRFVGIEALHVTLRFLGEVEASLDARGREAWRAVARDASPLRLRIGGIGTFPAGRRARVLWLGAEEMPPEGRVAALAASLESAALALGLRPETREFHAHVTLARAIARSGAMAPADPGGPLGEFVARRIVLFRSVLGRGGARYEEIEAFPLGFGDAASAIVEPAP
jgi:2'-5' RNA ligase